MNDILTVTLHVRRSMVVGSALDIYRLIDLAARGTDNDVERVLLQKLVMDMDSYVHPEPGKQGDRRANQVYKVNFKKFP